MSPGKTWIQNSSPDLTVLSWQSIWVGTSAQCFFVLVTMLQPFVGNETVSFICFSLWKMELQGILRKSSMSIQKGSHHCPFWDFVLEALLSVALLTFADRHRVFLRLVLDLEQIGGGHLSPCTGGSCPSPSRTSSPISVAAAPSSSLALPPSFIQFDESYLKWYVYSLGGSMIKRNIY